MSHMSISQFIKEMIKEYKNEARQNYLENQEMLDAFAVNGVLDRMDINSIKMVKFNCIMDAGVYNRDKKMYQRGYNKVMNHMFKCVENDVTDNLVLFDTNNRNNVTKNENAYLTLCNHFKLEKERLERRHKDLLNCGYFD